MVGMENIRLEVEAEGFGGDEGGGKIAVDGVVDEVTVSPAIVTGFVAAATKVFVAGALKDFEVVAVVFVDEGGFEGRRSSVRVTGCLDVEVGAVAELVEEVAQGIGGGHWVALRGRVTG